MKDQNGQKSGASTNNHRQQYVFVKTFNDAAPPSQNLLKFKR